MDQFQGNPYGYPNPYEPAFSQRIKQYANGVANFPRPAVLALEVISVPDISQVEQTFMAPGDRKIVFVQNNPNLMAIRIADNAGFVSTEYRETRIIDPKTLTPQQPQYALAQEVDSLKSDLEKIKAMMGVTNAKSTAEPVAGV